MKHSICEGSVYAEADADEGYADGDGEGDDEVEGGILVDIASCVVYYWYGFGICRPMQISDWQLWFGTDVETYV